MYAQVEKSKENKSRAVANSVTQKKKNQGIGFVDNRPTQLAKKKIQTVGSNVKETNITQCQSSSVIQLDKMTEHRLIQAALNAFINSWTADKVKGDIKGAFNALSGLLGKWGIRYGDQAGSKASFPNVHGLHIGEILDMLNTLHMFLDDSSGFIPQKFWDKVLTMSEMMGEIADE